ncbi:AbrB/MazE/SpoVT family DNA-binding domain-containing protein [Salmonella enterica]|nr:AbrB/MazE/SpoVT family DNA-binding domain-containing protein [Salmonella enterica]
MINVSVKKWGNSPAIRIPSTVMQALNLNDNSELELDIRDGILYLKPIPQERFSYTLDELLAGITPDNIHRGIDFGPDIGKEIVEYE